MSEAPEKDQQTEAPTPKRKADATKEGDVLASKELATALMMLAGCAWLIGFGGWFFNAAKHLLESGLSLDLSDPDRFEPMAPLAAALGELAFLLAALIGATLVAALAAPAMLGSLGVRGKAMAFKGNRLNPVAGLKRMFGAHGVIELAKATAKVALLGSAGYWVMMRDLAAMPGLATTDPARAATMIGDTLIWVVAILCAGLALIACIDVPVQWFQRNRRLRMSIQQLKEEHRQSDGAPELKQALRARQQELLMSSARSGMAQATVVLTNPTHFAVALRYRPGIDAAPVVVARGRGDVALAIRALAIENTVPTLEYPLLARAIYFTSRTGKLVSDDLYVAVAAILAFVFRLELSLANELVQPVVEIPPSKRFDADGRHLA